MRERVSLKVSKLECAESSLTGQANPWDSEKQDFEDDPDHEWHFRYNRRLSCFSNAVCSLTFSVDGRYLVSGTGSGDVKIWDTGCWAEAAKLKGCKREEPRSLVISPAQRWLVAAYPKALHVFNCFPPWKLEQSLPALLDPTTKEQSEWACVAFSPLAEVDHPNGRTGQDNNLAAFSTDFLLVMDYSAGWDEDAPRRTRSLMQSGKPTSVVYSPCGSWLICGFGNGQLQIWNTASLTMTKTLTAHTDVVNCIDSSPADAPYVYRFVSCSVDQTLRVWHSQGWVLEQHVHDMRCDRAGVRQCMFSRNGKWLLSVAQDLCVWRINVSKQGRLALTLHQRLAAVCGAEGLRQAAFGCQEAIAVGSRDGVLGLWTKAPGLPQDPAEELAGVGATANTSMRRNEWVEHRPARPMNKVTMGGVQPLVPGRPMGRGDWLQQMQFRRTSAMGSNRTIVGVNAAANATGRLVCSSSPKSNTPTAEDFKGPLRGPPQRTMSAPSPQKDWAVSRSTSVPDMARWKAASRKDSLVLSPSETIDFARPLTRGLPLEFEAEVETPVRKSINHACRGLVTRISLDPKVITEQGQTVSR